MQINKKQEEFNDLQTARKNLRAEIKRNNYSGMYSYLSNMYDDVTHFIYEMIQNADDTNASYFDLRLFKDRVEIRHNGKPFTIEDVTSITNIGDSKKENKIGYKGIGFKSVFAFSDRPAIYSEYNFEIEEYIVPITIESRGIEKDDKETLIVLPFIKDESINEIYQKINKKIADLNIKEFLFLNNIETFIFSVDNEEVKRIDKTIEDLAVDNSKKFILKSEKEILKYIVIKDNDNDNEFVKIAFKIDEDTDVNKINIIPELSDEKCSSIYAFFPTEEKINFNFLIQGPYDTSQDRKSIDFQKLVNKEIINNTAELLGQCMDIFKKLDIMDINSFKVLPINKQLAENSNIYKQFYDVLGEKICNGKILITNSKEYCNLDEVLLAADKQICEIYEAKHFNKSKNTYWLSDEFIEIKDTLIEYGLIIIDDTQIIKNLDIKSIEEMEDVTLIQFYKYIFSTKERFSRYSTIPMIKTNENTFKSFKDNFGNENIFLNIDKEIDASVIEQLEINIFNSELCNLDKELAKLVNKIFKSFNALASIEKLLCVDMKNNQKSLIHDLYFENLDKILKTFKYIYDENDKIAVIKSIEKNLPICYIDPLKNEEFYGSLEDTDTKYYWLDKDIKNLYADLPSIKIKTNLINYKEKKHRFINVILYKTRISEELFASFVALLKKCEVSDNIYNFNEMTCKNGKYYFYNKENQKKFDARQYSPTLLERVYNPSILYIKDILQSINSNQSKVLWKVVFEFFNRIEFRTEGYFINNFGSSSKKVEIELDICLLLSTSKWIYINGQLRKPNEIKYVDLLNNGYFLGDENDEVRINKYQRLCMLLDISTNQNYSKKELEAQEKVNYLDKEELLKLIKYIESRIDK